MTLPANFHAKTKPADCIVWTGALNSRGYPCFAVAGKSQLAHRVAYEDAYGPIPDEMTVDHLCGFRRCVNPAHLEVVTLAENNRRANVLKEECAEGHPLVRRSSGKRGCPICDTEASLRHQDRFTLGAGGAPSRVVRAWAIEQGLPVSPRGNLPTYVRRAYESAQLADSA